MYYSNFSEIKQPYLFVVMELGETDLSLLLKSVLNEKKKLPYTMVLHYWMEMLSAVKYIHDNGNFIFVIIGAPEADQLSISLI